jgi:hypothetical protein
MSQDELLPALDELDDPLPEDEELLPEEDELPLDDELLPEEDELPLDEELLLLLSTPSGPSYARSASILSF